MILFVDGALMMASAVVALLFLRAWRRTSDRLFLLFSLAFWILAINRFFIAMSSQGQYDLHEHRVLFYVVRLTAFLMILIAIIDKNRRGRPTAGS